MVRRTSHKRRIVPRSQASHGGAPPRCSWGDGGSNPGPTDYESAEQPSVRCKIKPSSRALSGRRSGWDDGDSDIDVLVVLDRYDPSAAIELKVEAFHCSSTAAPFDVSFTDPERFETARPFPARSSGQPFSTDAACSAASGPAEPVSRGMSWLDKATNDLRIAEVVPESAIGIEWAVCFHSRQAAENAIKGPRSIDGTQPLGCRRPPSRGHRKPDHQRSRAHPQVQPRVRLNNHTRTHWLALAGVDLRFRANFASRPGPPSALSRTRSTAPARSTSTTHCP